MSPSIDLIPPIAERPHLSQLIPSIYGSYAQLNEYPSHYFLCTISLECLHSDILTMRDIPGVEKWGLEALFQREINDSWVDDIVNRYIRDPQRLKFFPPVTVALLPHDPTHNSLLKAYESSFAREDVPGPQGRAYNRASMKGLTIDFPQHHSPDNTFPPFGHYSQIQWDKNIFHAIAIDGQHRISALKKAWGRNNPQLNKYDVPAIFLVLDPKSCEHRTLVQATREIFIDINRSSQRVDDSRLILLDDRRIHNALTRKLIWPSYSDDGTVSPTPSRPLTTEGATGVANAIPQELVDMRAGKNAFDVNQFRPWQYTSAFIMSRAIQHFMIENDISKLEKLLDASSYKKDSPELYKREFAQRREDYGREGRKRKNTPDDNMLAFTPPITKELSGTLFNRHGELLRAFFCGFTPYSKHIAKFTAATNGAMGELVREVMVSEGYSSHNTLWESVAAKQLRNTDAAKFEQVRDTILTCSRPTGWEEDLYWYSVFQRAAIYQPLHILECLQEATGTAFRTRGHFAEAALAALNEVHALNAFKKARSLWMGILTRCNAAGEVTIDSSDAAAKRAGHLIRLLLALASASPRRRTDLIEKINKRRDTSTPRFVSAAAKTVDAMATCFSTTAPAPTPAQQNASAIERLRTELLSLWPDSPSATVATPTKKVRRKKKR
jgi:hypothetical protein